MYGFLLAKVLLADIAIIRRYSECQYIVRVKARIIAKSGDKLVRNSHRLSSYIYELPENRLPILLVADLAIC